jgi:glycosyltransferase involved in cell wall biosynthesis
MKVIHVIRSLNKAGAEKLCIDICNELSKRENMEVLLISMNERNDFNEIEITFPLKIVNSKVVPSISKKSLIDVFEFSSIVEDFKPDIIHSHLFWSELLSRQKTFPWTVYVTHCHDNINELEKFSLSTLLSKRKITKFFERKWIIKKYRECKNNFIVISEDSEKYFNTVLPRDIQNIKLLHNAIDVKKYNPPFLEIKKDSNIIRLVNVGRFATYKNQQFLVKVVKIISDKGFNVELNFLGTGPEINKVKNQVKEYQLERKVFFHGIVDNVNEHLWQADIYVHAAFYEPFGLVLLEAMAAGLPVITLNGRGNVDIIEQNKNAIMINSFDEEEFANAVIDLWCNEDNYFNIAKYARQYSEGYDIKNYADKLIDYYNSLLSERRK